MSKHSTQEINRERIEASLHCLRELRNFPDLYPDESAKIYAAAMDIQDVHHSSELRRKIAAVNVGKKP